MNAPCAIVWRVPASTLSIINFFAYSTTHRHKGTHELTHGALDAASPLAKDHEEPELADYERGVDFIKRWHGRGGKVLVHCKAGHGR